MAAPCQSACSTWCSQTDVQRCAHCSALTGANLDLAIAAASDVLFELSGRQFPGSCADIIRPCGAGSCSCGCGGWGTGIYAPGASYSAGAGYPAWNPTRPWIHQPRDCSCSANNCCENVPRVHLLEPATSIIQIKIDGAIVDPTTYRIDDFRWLTRTTNPTTHFNGGWPCCQNLGLPTTEPNTFEVNYSYGVPPPTMGVLAAAELACEIDLACTGNAACRLPPRVQSIARQGVTFLLTSLAELRDGFTGLGGTVDLFIQTYNPQHLRNRAVAWSPDTQPQRTKQTWP